MNRLPPPRKEIAPFSPDTVPDRWSGWTIVISEETVITLLKLIWLALFVAGAGWIIWAMVGG